VRSRFLHTHTNSPFAFTVTMPSFAFVTALLLASTLHSGTATVLRKMMDEYNIPSGRDWMSLSKNVDYMPAPAQDLPQLRIAQKRLLNYYKQDFVDGLETQYNEYAQAWRYMGLYMDCGYAVARRLEEQAAEQNQGERHAAQAASGSCMRYLLWAAVSVATQNPQHAQKTTRPHR
jgi:hypothetical protein